MSVGELVLTTPSLITNIYLDAHAQQGFRPVCVCQLPYSLPLSGMLRQNKDTIDLRATITLSNNNYD